MNEDVSHLESQWKPKSWNRHFRFLFVRTRSKKKEKGPVQLDLFEPYEYGHEFKVILTNKDVGAQAIRISRRARFPGECVRPAKDPMPDGLHPRANLHWQSYLLIGHPVCPQPGPRITKDNAAVRTWYHRGCAEL